MTWTFSSGFEPEVFPSTSVARTDSEAATSLRQRAVWVSFTSFPVMQQNTNPTEYRSLAYLLVPGLLEAVAMLSARFRVRNTTGMLFKIKQNGCASPTDMITPDTIREQQPQVLK